MHVDLGDDHRGAGIDTTTSETGLITGGSVFVEHDGERTDAGVVVTPTTDDDGERTLDQSVFVERGDERVDLGVSTATGVGGAGQPVTTIHASHDGDSAEVTYTTDDAGLPASIEAEVDTEAGWTVAASVANTPSEDQQHVSLDADSSIGGGGTPVVTTHAEADDGVPVGASVGAEGGPEIAVTLEPGGDSLEVGGSVDGESTADDDWQLDLPTGDDGDLDLIPDLPDDLPGGSLIPVAGGADDPQAGDHDGVIDLDLDRSSDSAFDADLDDPWSDPTVPPDGDPDDSQDDSDDGIFDTIGDALGDTVDGVGEALGGLFD